MAELTSVKETSNRHLRFKLQSLGRRLDELEEATKNLQKAEDEVLDLQDKIIQAEGSNSSMLSDVESLRKRVLKIEGKDEEVKKAEDLCRLMKEKLEEEEYATIKVKSQIENLQKRMTELETLEEAFSKSKNECTQLCLNLNEEKNVSKKLSTDLEVLKARIKEMEASEAKIDKTEQQFVSELEKIKSLTLMFINERKQLLEKERQNEKLIQDLKQKLEQNNRIHTNQTRNTSVILERSTKCNLETSDLRIEDDFSSKLPAKESRRKSSLDYVKSVENETIGVLENEKNKNQEDNKIKDLNQEIEKLKTQVSHLKSVEEELKQMNAKNNALNDRYLSEKSKNVLLTEQLEKLKIEVQKRKELENGIAESEEIASAGRFYSDKPRNRSETTAKYKSREHSPQSRRERVSSRDLSQNQDHISYSNRQSLNTSATNRRSAAFSSSGLVDSVIDVPKRADHKTAATVSHLSAAKDVLGSLQNDAKKSKEQPSVLSRYPPAAQEHNSKSWKTSSKPLNESGAKNRPQKTPRTFGEVYSVNTSTQNQSQVKVEQSVLASERTRRKSQTINSEMSSPITSSHGSTTLENGTPLSSNTCTQSPKLVVSSITSSPVTTTVTTSSSMAPSQSKYLNNEEADPLDATSQTTTPRSSSRYLQNSRNQGTSLSNQGHDENEDVHSGLETRKLSSSREPLVSKIITNASTNGKFNSEDADENVGDFAQEKTRVSVQPELERKGVYCAGETAKSRVTARTAILENDKKENETESKKLAKAYSNSVDNSDDFTPVRAQVKQPFSPREALRSKVIIKPVIIEKDLKEIMGGSGIDTHERLKSPKPVTSKMTSSITIYPSEPGSPRSSTCVTKKERVTSTSSIILTSSDLPLISNNNGTSVDISINKSITLETTKPENVGFQNEPESLISRSVLSVSSTDARVNNNNESAAETISWKSHSTVNASPSVEAKTHDPLNSVSRIRHSFSPLEEPDTKADRNKDVSDLSARLETLIDANTRPTRVRSRDQYTRRTSAMINSMNTPPDFVSRRSKSSLSASELVARRSYVGESPVSSWNHIPLEEEGTDTTIRSRRRPLASSDRISRTDTSGKRYSTKLDSQQDQQRLGSRIEDRILSRRYFSDEK
ncbi:leucine zipper protein 1 [Lissotriton helveticus]